MTPGSLNETSNWTDAEVREYLSELSYQAWTTRLPITLFLGALMAVGTADNLFAFVVYHRRYRPSSTRVFVLSMSACDLVINLLGLPLQITTIRYAYDSFNIALCRTFYVFATIPTQASGFYLILVAYDRYRHICHPFGTQLTAGQTWRLVGGASLLALLLFLPFTPFYGWHSVDSPVPGVKAVMCWIHDPFRQTVYPLVYKVVVAVTFFLGLTLIIVFYLLIGIHVFRHQVKMKRLWSGQKASKRKRENTKARSGKDNDCAAQIRFPSGANGCSRLVSEQLTKMSLSTISIILTTSSDSSVLSGAGPGAGDEGGDDPVTVFVVSRNQAEREVSCVLQPSANPSPERRGSSPPDTGGQDAETTGGKRQKRSCEGARVNKNNAIRSRTTLMMAVVTGFYIANWLPHLLMRLTNDSPANLCDNFTDCGLNMHGLTLRSYYINSAVNAFVYCFCSPRCRQQCRLLLTRKPRV